MDTARRWQVASVTTAVASLGLGAALLARPHIEVVPSIDLDQVSATAALRPQAPAVDADEPDGPSIVAPRTISLPTADNPASVTSPDEAEKDGEVSPDEPDTPSSDTHTSPAPPPAQPPTASDDSPASQHSPASVDSVSSVDSSD